MAPTATKFPLYPYCLTCLASRASTTTQFNNAQSDISMTETKSDSDNSSIILVYPPPGFQPRDGDGSSTESDVEQDKAIDASTVDNAGSVTEPDDDDNNASNANPYDSIGDEPQNQMGHPDLFSPVNNTLIYEGDHSKL